MPRSPLQLLALLLRKRHAEVSCTRVDFSRHFLFHLGIGVQSVDDETRDIIQSSSLAVFVVNSDSLSTLVREVVFDPYLGGWHVEFSYDSTLLVLVKALGYSTVSRAVRAYCDTGETL